MRIPGGSLFLSFDYRVEIILPIKNSVNQLMAHLLTMIYGVDDLLTWKTLGETTPNVENSIDFLLKPYCNLSKEIP